MGSNAFAHESGIHQDGMLKNRETYEIMTPQSIGRKSTDLVIGKHSGRNAVRTRLEELGYRLDDEQVNVVFAAVKDLADKKANVHDEDLEALVFSEVYRLPDRYRLGNVSVQTTMGSSMPATAAASTAWSCSGPAKTLMWSRPKMGAWLPARSTASSFSRSTGRSP